jgi:hypothetical protein
VCCLVFPPCPYLRSQGSEESSMGRGGRARLRRQRPFEVNPNEPVDLTKEDWWWLEGPPALGAGPPDNIPAEEEAPSEDEPGEADAPVEAEPIEVDLEEFLATHTATDEQVALLNQYFMGVGDPATVWANLLDSMMESIALSVAEDADPS